jgi:hypothetical protein
MNHNQGELKDACNYSDYDQLPDGFRNTVHGHIPFIILFVISPWSSPGFRSATIHGGEVDLVQVLPI